MNNHRLPPKSYDFTPSVHRRSSGFEENQYSDLFGIKRKSKAERQQRREDKKIRRARIKGEKEAARLGLDKMPEISLPQAEAAKPASGKLMLYGGIAAGVVLLILIVVMLKR